VDGDVRIEPRGCGVLGPFSAHFSAPRPTDESQNKQRTNCVSVNMPESSSGQEGSPNASNQPLSIKLPATCDPPTELGGLNPPKQAVWIVSMMHS
jgi:hypothetical protein